MSLLPALMNLLFDALKKGVPANHVIRQSITPPLTNKKTIEKYAPRLLGMPEDPLQMRGSGQRKEGLRVELEGGKLKKGLAHAVLEHRPLQDT